MNSIRYQDVNIPTARAYRDMHDFKDDIDNLSPQAAAQIEGLLKHAPFGPRFATVGMLDDALNELKVPGYGSFFANQIGARIDHSLEFMYVEIPKRNQNRYLAVERQPTGEYIVVADFVAPDQPEITRVRRAGNGGLEFLSSSGTLLQSRNAP
jgi:hypothetical protein